MANESVRWDRRETAVREPDCGRPTIVTDDNHRLVIVSTNAPVAAPIAELRTRVRIAVRHRAYTPRMDAFARWRYRRWYAKATPEERRQRLIDAAAAMAAAIRAVGVTMREATAAIRVR